MLTCARDGPGPHRARYQREDGGPLLITFMWVACNMHVGCTVESSHSSTNTVPVLYVHAPPAAAVSSLPDSTRCGGDVDDKRYGAFICEEKKYLSAFSLEIKIVGVLDFFQLLCVHSAPVDILCSCPKSRV